MSAANQQELGEDSATLEAAAAAFQLAQPALNSCKSLLPEEWVAATQAVIDAAKQLLPGIEAQLRYLHQASRSDGGGGSSSGDAAAGENVELAALARAAMEARSAATHAFLSSSNPEQIAHCCGCGKVAVGLRRCAGCRRAQYCRCGAAAQALAVQKEGPQAMSTALAYLPLPACSRECQVAAWASHKLECRREEAEGS